MSEQCEVPLSNADDNEISRILTEHKVIAVVGLSEKPTRASHRVAVYMQRAGYRIIPVNPGITEALGEQAFASLTDIPVSVDIVDIFRRPEAVPEIVEQAIEIGAKVIWMQEGIVHNEAAEKARKAGLTVVMNKCLLKEHRRVT